MRDTMVKINDRYEFPLQLDLDRENGKYLSPQADRSVRNLYTLHSVLVHSGGVHGGHYYAYIRPTLSDQWLKFDDERVTKEDMKRALDEQYGGEEELPQANPGFNNSPFKFTKYSNAYMLVYIRESDKEKIICNVDEKDVAEHLRIRLKKEQEEKELKRKEKAEAHLYTIIKVARDENLHEQIGKNIFFDLVDHDKVRSFRIQKQTSFSLFKEEVAKELGIPVQFQRFWLWAKRQNHTYRPNRPLTPLEEAQSVGHLREVSNKNNNAELKLFLEVELGQDSLPVPPPAKTKEEIFLFFKLYDPVKEELRYVGRLFVKGTGKPMEILAKLNELAGFAPDEDIELFEEIKFEPNVMCEHVDKKLTFRASQLEDGDIICLQKPLQPGTVKCRYPNVPSFLEYVHNRQVVRFRSLEKPKEDEFSLELSKLNNYDDVVERVASHLSLDDPSKIRLTSHNCYSQQPKPQPIKYRGVEHLSDMLAHYNQTSDILYYEVLDIPLPELQGLKTLKVAFHHATKDEVVIHTIRLPKQSTVGDVINDLKTKVELSHKDAELRLLEVFYHKIYKIFPLNEKIENINDQYWTLRAEEIPEEEKDLGPQDRLIHVYHFTKDASQNQVQVQNFGEPFFLVIREGETLAEVKVRIQKKLQVPDEEFTKWKFAFLSLGRPTYLQDADVVSTRFQRRDVYGAWEQYLGLEHSDNASKRSYAANQFISDGISVDIYLEKTATVPVCMPILSGENNHKWLIPDPTNVRKTRRRPAEEDPQLFGDDALPCPPDKKHYRAKSQRSSNLSATSNSQEAFHEIMQQQLALDRETKMEEMRNETRERVNLIKAQTKNEDMRTLAINIDGMNPSKKEIKDQKCKVRIPESIRKVTTMGLLKAYQTQRKSAIPVFTMETNTSRMIYLNGLNYKLWRTKMEDLLYVKGFHQPIFCSEKPKGKTNEEWKLLHRQVCAYIRQWVNDDVLNHVGEEVNAHTLLSKLEQLYARQTCNKKLFLIKQLMGLRYRDGTAMSDHLIIFQEIVNELTEIGIRFDEEVQGLMLLGTLPDSWEGLKISLSNSAPQKDVISMALVKSSVLDAEMNRKSQGSTSHSYGLVLEEGHKYVQRSKVYGQEQKQVMRFKAKNHERGNGDITNEDLVAAKRPSNSMDRKLMKQDMKNQDEINEDRVARVPQSRPSELQAPKSLEVSFHHATKDEDILVNSAPDGVISDGIAKNGRGEVKVEARVTEDAGIGDICLKLIKGWNCLVMACGMCMLPRIIDCCKREKESSLHDTSEDLKSIVNAVDNDDMTEYGIKRIGHNE
ncbi:putative ubiquitinyl hydrolase 1 [Tanacetum coccineum]